MEFIIIYALEAHPSGDPSPYSGKEWTGSYSADKDGNPVGQPRSYEDRVQQAIQTIEDEGIAITVLVDEMDNAVWCTYGAAPNIAYLIGRDGTVVAKQGWFDAAAMKEEIVAYLGDG